MLADPAKYHACWKFIGVLCPPLGYTKLSRVCIERNTTAVKSFKNKMDGRLVCNQDTYREVDVSIYRAEIDYTPMKNHTCVYTLSYTWLDMIK